MLNVRCGGNDTVAKSEVTYLGATLYQSLSGDAIAGFHVMSHPPH